MMPHPSTATAAVAAVKVAPEETELQTFDLPEIGPDAALLRVESTGVGGSDPEQYRRATRIPSIMGHEIVGELVEIGTGAASRWGAAVGDRVALHEYLPCWHCRWCLQGDFRLCEEVDFFVVKDPLRFGMTETAVAPSLWGGYSQYVYVPGNAVVHKLPPELPSHLATLAIPLGNGFQWAVLDGGTQVGSNVLVVGPGQQGLGCTLAAKSAGAQTVILAGHTRDAARLESGLRFGADHAVDAEKDDLRSTVMRLTGGHGVDVVVDTTGDPTGEVAADAVAVAAKGATLNLNGLGQSIGIGDIKRGYFTVRAPRGHSYRSVDLALRLIASDRFPIEEMVSHRFALDQVDRAIRATAGRDVAGAIHVTVDPWS